MDARSELGASTTASGTHTPGPWKAVCVGSTDALEHIYEVHSNHPDFTRVVAEYVRKDDAELLAAAPELAEVLRQIVSLENDPQPGLFTWQAARAEAHKEAHTLLAKIRTADQTGAQK